MPRESASRKKPDRADAAPTTPPRSGFAAYLHDASRPFASLVFLLPLIVFYEFGSIRWLQPQQLELEAYAILRDVMAAVGVVGLHLPSIIIVVVLLVWHILTNDPWRARFRLTLAMAAESILLAMPLLLLAQVFQGYQLAAGAESLSKPAAATIAIGAGLYEETVFRLVGMTLLHAIASEMLGLKRVPATIIAVLGCTIAFVLLHEPSPWDARLFYAAASIYLCAIFALRGFGIVVGAHAAYDIAVLMG